MLPAKDPLPRPRSPGEREEGAKAAVDATTQLRWAVYALLIALAGGIVAGRLLAVQLVYEPSLHRPADRPDLPGRVWPAKPPKAMPTFSSNDRSRWATVRALVDEGTYVIGRRDPSAVSSTNKYGDVGIVFEDGWGTVDKVLHPQTGEYYSSKPPFLATFVAAEYWLLQRAFGWTLTDTPWEVVRSVLFTVNWLPFLIYLGLLAVLAERLGTTDWGRLLMVAAAAFGTFLTTFMTTLNNHWPAAFAVALAIASAMPIWNDQRRDIWRFVLCGFFAVFAACCELPASAFAAAMLLALAGTAPARAILGFALGGLPPLAFFFLTNYLAVGMLTPVQAMFGSEWYLYEGSHWLNIQRNPRGIDAAADPWPIYLLHLLIGHHGFFSLTPIFLLSLVGIGIGMASRDPTLRTLAWLTPMVSLIVLAFYLVKTNNYGGWTSGPRWFFWLIPLWLVMLLPAADRLARSRWGRGLALLLLACSALHAAYPAWNPWRHPSLYNLLESWGWISY
jgi:hypothetical protein